MLNQRQLQKLQSMNLPPALFNQVIRAAGGVQQPKTVGGFAGNVVKSGANAVGGVASSLINVLNPNMEKNTVANLARLGVGTAQLLDPTQVLGTGQEETARNVGRFYDQRYGISDLARGDFRSAGNKAFNSFYNDPVGVALDASAVVGGAGSVAKGLGAASKISGLSRVGRALGTASEFIDPIQLAGRGVGFAGRGLGGKVASGLDKASESIVTRGLGNPRELAKAEGVAGMSAGKLMKKYNVFDRSAESLGDAASGINAQRSEMVGTAIQAGKSANIRKIVEAFDTEIAKLQELGKTSDKAAAQAAELSRRKSMFMQSLATNNNVPILEKINQIKSDFQADIPESTFGMPTQDIGKAGGTTQAYRTLLGGLENSLPGIRQIGREESAFYKLQKAAKSAESRRAARNPISLGKIVSGGVGGAVAGIPGIVGGMAVEAVANSPLVTMLASKGLSGAASVVKGVKVPKAVTFGTSALYGAGRAARMGIDPNRQKDETNQSTTQLYRQPQTQQANRSMGLTYQQIVPLPPKAPQKVVTKEIKYSLPKKTFSNTAPFGKTFRLRTQ